MIKTLAEDWGELVTQGRFVVDDLVEVMEWLRESECYEQSDRVRTIAGRLARALPNKLGYVAPDERDVFDIARTYK